jgi:PTS system mannose-specific IID component
MIPFLLAGFFLVQYSGVSTIGASLVGVFLAFLYYLFLVRPKREANPVAAVDESSVQHVLTKKELNKSFWMWILFGINCESWERKLGIGFGSAMIPSLKVLYKNDPEGYKEAMSRELEFFNTEKCFGACIPGVAIAMEEQKALGAPITGEAISSVKTGLMGPFAGIGDSIMWGPVYILCVALFIPACADHGSWLAAIMPVILFAAIGIIIARLSFNLGYKNGAKSAAGLLQGGAFADMIPILTVVGMFMIGALAANYVSVTTPLVFNSSTGLSFSVQDTLDSIAPGLLSLGTLFVSYFVTKKFKNFLWTALIMLALGIVLGCLGIIV